MAWLFVPGLVGSNSGSTSPNPDTELWVSLSGKHEQRPLSWRGWRTRRWVKLLSGTTLAPSTADAGVDAWISSLRASRASRSASPDSNGESRTSATCGRTLPGSLARYALRGYCSKTSPVSQQPSLLMDEAPSKRSATTFKSWVSRSRGMSSQRQRWGQAIFASESSLWPTPRAEDTETTGAHRGVPDTLPSAANMWPTPDAGVRTGFNRSASDGAANRPLLAEAANMWPTPNTPSGGPNTKSTPTHTGGMDLEGAVAMRATPSVADVTGGHMTRGGVRSGELLLPGQAAIHWWATPAARSTKGGHSEEALTRQDGKSRMDIHNQAIYFPPFLQGETSTTDGEPSSPSTRGSRRLLNPDFVEWLMGWPIGWSALDLPLPATGWSRWWQRMRGSLCALGWRI